MQLDLSQINLPVNSAVGERLRQVWSVAATWPLIYPLVKYRNIATRVAVTIAMLAVIRSGLYIALPGVDLAAVPAALPAREGERLVRALYGQATALPASLFDLGISPYINASIFVVMVLAIPDPALAPIKSLMRLKEARKQGRSGQAFITSVINSLALLVAVYLALIKSYSLLPFALFSASFVPHTTLSLVAGSAIIQHCANIITASGIGNGSSLVICMSIMDEYAAALHNVLSRSMAGVADSGALVTLLVCYMGLALAAVYISRTELRLPTMQYASVAAASQGPNGHDPQGEDAGMDAFAAARRRAELRMASRHTRVDYFPLQINTSGMMSIILAGAFWFVLLPSAAEFCGLVGLQQGLLALQSSYWGLLIYGLFVMALEFVPLGGVNPKEVAEYLSAINVGIKGIIPGEPTEKHIQSQLLRCKFWGGLALGTLAVFAQLFDMACMRMLGASLSATSLLIIVGTVMQSSRQVESLLEGPRLNEKLSKEQALIQGLRAI